MFCRWAQSDFGIFTHLHVLPFYLLVRVFSSVILCLIWLPASLTKIRSSVETIDKDPIKRGDDKNLTWEWGADRKFRPEGHYLTSRGCAEWCKTVIPRDGIFYQHRTLMSCKHFDSECFIVKAAFITTQNDVGIGHFLKLTSLHWKFVPWLHEAGISIRYIPLMEVRDFFKYMYKPIDCK